MARQLTRRSFIAGTGALAGRAAVGSGTARQPRIGPHQFIIVEGHRDIWEFNDRFALREDSQNSPLRDFLLPRLLEGGVDVVVVPAGGDSVPQRAGSERPLEGSLRVVDMLHSEIEKTGGQASIIRTSGDLPTSPGRNHLRFFLDLEGGASIEIDPEPDYHPDRRLALLRNFFRLGVRGMQLTHHGRNQLGDGFWEGKLSGRLSRFGVEVVQEMNRLGMMIGVSHLSANGIFHVAEITEKPIASTHTNLQKFIDTPRQHSDEEVKAIASTGGLVGIRYIEGRTSYQLLADEIDYMIDLVGVEHVAVGWLGHDEGHPSVGHVPGFTRAPAPSGVEDQTMFDHWSRFISILEQRGYRENQIGLILGGNFLRIWKEILPG